MGYHALPFALAYVLPYFYGNSVPFLAVTNFNTLPGVFLYILANIFSEISLYLWIFQRVTTFEHCFLERCYVLILLKMYSNPYSDTSSNELKMVMSWKWYATPIKTW